MWSDFEETTGTDDAVLDETRPLVIALPEVETLEDSRTFDLYGDGLVDPPAEGAGVENVTWVKVVWLYDPGLAQPVLRATNVRVRREGTQLRFTLDLSGWRKPANPFVLKLVAGDPIRGRGVWTNVTFE